MGSHQLINQDSGNTEYYTDPRILEAAREVLGYIDLDPASSMTANKFVQAKKIFNADGLGNRWYGKIWMNHPFSKREKACNTNCKKKTCVTRGHHISEDVPGNKDWISKLVNSYNDGAVTEALCICFAATSEGWFQPLAGFPQCYLAPRTNYYNSEGEKVSGVTKGSVVTYLGSDIKKFAEVFSKFGVVKVAY